VLRFAQFVGGDSVAQGARDAVMVFAKLQSLWIACTEYRVLFHAI
jgi:hypothetical protein